MNNSLYWFERILPSDRLQVGEKAYALSCLQQQGYPVFPGFVIGAATFRHFLNFVRESAPLMLDFPDSSLYFAHDNYKALQLVAQQSRKAILETALPPEWVTTLRDAATVFDAPTLILRSSVTAPSLRKSQIGGLLPSQICLCQLDALEMALKRTWAELFGAKSLFYWKKSGIGLEEINLAVLVQPFRNALAAGVARINSNQIDIQSTWGLGYSLVKGEVLPDCYQVELATRRVKTRQLGHKNRAYRLKEWGETCLEAYLLSQEEQEQYSLNEQSLNRLIELLSSLAQEKGYRGALEWILTPKFDNQSSEFYLTQSIPDLLHQSPASSQTMREDSQPILTGLSAAPGVVSAAILVITDMDSVLLPIPEGKILVAQQITPDWLPWLKQAVGIITEKGGITSHAAIIAREMGIPAIVGASNATKLLKTDQSVCLNGTQGKVYHLSARQNTQKTTKKKQQVITYPTIATKLMVNLSQPDSLVKAAVLPVDGVGLLRSELMLLELGTTQPLKDWLKESQRVLFVEKLADLISQFVSAFTPRPVFYRSFDCRTSDFPNFTSGLMGERGTYNYLLDPTLFTLELQALAQVTQTYTNLNLILPFVRSVEEFSFCRRRIEEVGLTQYPSFQLWIMAEVPSVIFLLSEYLKAGVQGIAIGTNDLTHLILGVERDNGSISQHFNASHPAILIAMEQLITTARKSGIPCSICGQAPLQYPELIDLLIQWGITSISVDPSAVDKTYQAIARAEKRLLLEAARSQF